MKKLLLVLSSLLFIGCGWVSPDAGEEAVLVKKPFIFGSGGLVDTPVKTGLTWRVWSTKAYTFNLKPQQITEQFSDLMSSDNVPVSFNAYFQYQIIEGRTPYLLDKFGYEFYDTKIKEYFRTQVRSFAKSHAVFKLSTNASVVDLGQTEITANMKLYIEKEGIPIKVLSVVIGRVLPPTTVVKQTELTAVQKQRLKTEKQRALAELTRKNAEENRALADKAYRTKFGMNTSEYIQLKMVEMLHEKENLTIIMGGASPVVGVGVGK